MERQELYPELIDYIFDYEDSFMTDYERAAAGRILLTSEGIKERKLEGRNKVLEISKKRARKTIIG